MINYSDPRRQIVSIRCYVSFVERFRSKFVRADGLDRIFNRIKNYKIREFRTELKNRIHPLVSNHRFFYLFRGSKRSFKFRDKIFNFNSRNFGSLKFVYFSYILVSRFSSVTKRVRNTMKTKGQSKERFVIEKRIPRFDSVTDSLRSKEKHCGTKGKIVPL